MKHLFSTFVAVIAIVQCSCAQAYLPLAGGTLTGGLVINGPYLIFQAAGTNTFASGSTATVVGSGSGTDHINYVYGNNPFSIWTNNTKRLVVDGSGNVGIGTASPGTPLAVSYDNASNGGVTNLLTLAQSNADNRSGGTGAGINFAIGNFGNPAATKGLIRVENTFYNDNSKMTFSTTHSNVLNDQMTIDDNGNVGIGTSQPDAKLTVNGTIHSSEVKVNTSIPVPDYVFEPTYKLPQLSELKTYLDANHHLPEIPSAAELAKNGINLSEMNLRLLKKVEELTLYLIEKDAKQTQLEKKIAAQEKQLKEQQDQLNLINDTLKLTIHSN